MKYIISLLIALAAAACGYFSGDIKVTAVLVIVSVLITLIFEKISDRKREKELEEVISLILKLQNSPELPELRSSEGNIGILKSEIYKLVTCLTQRAGNASKEKKYLADMLSDISHQIKTPLTAISIMTDLLSQDDLPVDKRIEFTENIEKQTNKIIWLIKNLLVMSQLEASVIKLKKENCSCFELIDKACEPLRLMAEVKNTELVTEQSKENIILSCDVSWTSEVIANIVKNCIEHTPENGKVTVKMSQNNLGTSIVVSDTGPGISKEDMPHIFERFYKGKNSSKDSVGIGLAIARQIMINQNGNITAENTDTGCCFTIRFYS